MKVKSYAEKFHCQFKKKSFYNNVFVDSLYINNPFTGKWGFIFKQSHSVIDENVHETAVRRSEGRRMVQRSAVQRGPLLYALKIGEKWSLDKSQITVDLEEMYDGYLFNERAENKLFNSTMILYYFL